MINIIILFIVLQVIDKERSKEENEAIEERRKKELQHTIFIDQLKKDIDINKYATNKNVKEVARKSKKIL